MNRPIFLILVLGALLSVALCANGEAADIKLPEDAILEVIFSLSVTTDTNAQTKVSGEVLIKNAGVGSLTIQDPFNRLALAFLVFDPLGNPVAPVVSGKADPGFATHCLPSGTTYRHHFDTLFFVTGSALLSYDLKPGKTYRVLAVYRPSGLNGFGYTSREACVSVPDIEPQRDK